MTLKREYMLFFLSPLLLVVIGVGALQLITNRGRPYDQDRQKGLLLYQEVRDLVEGQYVIDPDREKLAYGAAKGMAATLDRYCRVYEPSEWTHQQQSDDGTYDGIGIRLDVLKGRVTILKATPGGPAFRAGVRDGSVLLSIDGEEVGRKPVLQDVKDRISGRRGSRVTLKIADYHGGDERELEVVRGTASVESVYGEMLEGEDGVGYLRVMSFKGNTIEQFNRHLQDLLDQGLRSLILDLRGNRGGTLSVAVAMADRFLSGGTIVTTLGRNFKEPHMAEALRDDLEVPLVVLVDGSSASASEVLVGALQDHGRAVVVGERTYGKGVVQGKYEFLHGPGGIKLTIAHYFTPAGRCIEKELALGNGAKRRGGLTPDVPIPLSRLHRGYAMGLADRRRYQRFLRRAIAEENETIPRNFKDPHLSRAVQLLAGVDSDLPTIALEH